MSKAMKDSGIPWIGEIPKDWSTDRAKNIFVQSTTKGNERLVLQSATQDRGVVDKDTLEGVVQVAADADLRTFKTVHIDDFVISLRSFQGGFEICHNEGVISPAYTVFRLRKKSYTGYYRLLFKSYGFIDKINSLTVGIREGKNIQYRDFADMEIPIPSEVEQQRIAEFLDRKCGEIDETIALQEEFIEELKSYKQSVITEAVTRGLNPNVKFKDSGVDWIGKIPQGWKLIRLKYLCKIETGNQDTQDAVPDGEYPFYVRSPQVERSNKATFEGEGILMAGDGAGAGRVFHHAYGKYAVHQRVYRLSEIEGVFSNYLFFYISNLFGKVMDMGSAQSTVPSVRLPMLTNFAVCIPSPKEQHQIADYLDNKCAEIDSLIAIKQQKIEELKEYKKSIIYEYVTGKKEVDG